MTQHPVYASTAGIARHFRTLSGLLRGLISEGINKIELGWAPSSEGLSMPQDLGKFHANWLIHNYFPAPRQAFLLNLASQNAVNLRLSRDFAVASVRLCAALGAPFYSVHCGFLAEIEPSSLGRRLTYSELCDYERGYTTFLSSLELLLAEARAVGVGILIEPNVVEPTNLTEGRNSLLMMAEPHEFTRLLTDLPDKSLGILLDLGHLKVTSATLGFAAVEFIEAVAPSVGAFHLHDNDGGTDQHLPAAGDSWALDVVRQSRFSGRPVIIEAKFNSARAMIEYYIWLNSLLNP